jgi:hypothetical protein
MRKLMKAEMEPLARLVGAATSRHADTMQLICCAADITPAHGCDDIDDWVRWLGISTSGLVSRVGHELTSCKSTER